MDSSVKGGEFEEVVEELTSSREGSLARRGRGRVRRRDIEKEREEEDVLLSMKRRGERGRRGEVIEEGQSWSLEGRKERGGDMRAGRSSERDSGLGLCDRGKFREVRENSPSTLISFLLFHYSP